MSVQKQKQELDLDSELLKAVDELAIFLKDEEITDAKKAGEMMNEYARKHNISIEGGNVEQDNDNYTKVTQKECMKAFRIALDVHNHELEQ